MAGSGAAAIAPTGRRGSAGIGRGGLYVHRALHWVLASGCTLTALSSALNAQPLPVEPGVPTRLSLEAAVAIALEHSPVYRRAISAVRASELGERQRMGALLPSAAVSIGYTGYTSRKKTAFDDLGRPLEEPDFVENTTSSAAQGVHGALALLDLQKLRTWRESRARTTAASARARLQAARLRTDIGTAYYAVIHAEQRVAVEERALRAARRQLVAIRQLLGVGSRQPTDLLGAELDVARAERVVQQAQGEAARAHLLLRQRMGVPLASEFDVVLRFRAVFDPRGLEPAVLIERAARESPELTERLSAAAVAEASLSAARAARYPRLSISYGYSRGTNAPSYDAFGRLHLPDSGWRFGVALQFALLDQFRSSSDAGRARAEVETVREMVRETRLNLEGEIRAALIDLENAHAGVRLAERSAEIARERLRQGQEQYRLGRLQDYTVLQQMTGAVADQERAVVSAHYTFSVALLTLEEKLGGPGDLSLREEAVVPPSAG